MSPLNPASLVGTSLHSHEMLELLELHVQQNLIDHLVQSTMDAVAFAFDVAPGSIPGFSELNLAAFEKFVSNVVHRANVTIGVLLVTLLYMKRAQPHLTIVTVDYAHERVFLGALVCASKYTQDATFVNSQWARATGKFGRRDVGRVEREFLDVLDWDLRVTESQILENHDSVMGLYPHPPSPLAHHSPPSPSEPLPWLDSDSETPSPASSAPMTPPTPPHHLVFPKHPFHHNHSSTKSTKHSSHWHIFSKPWGQGLQIPEPHPDSEFAGY